MIARVFMVLTGCLIALAVTFGVGRFFAWGADVVEQLLTKRRS